MKENYYAKIYVGNGRPTGQILPESEIDTKNRVTMDSWTKLGMFESYREARDDYNDSVCEDERGFEWWK